jgi:hypothetical protein
MTETMSYKMLSLLEQQARLILDTWDEYGGCTEFEYGRLSEALKLLELINPNQGKEA